MLKCRQNSKKPIRIFYWLSIVTSFSIVIRILIEWVMSLTSYSSWIHLLIDMLRVVVFSWFELFCTRRTVNDHHYLYSTIEKSICWQDRYCMYIDQVRLFLILMIQMKLHSQTARSLASVHLSHMRRHFVFHKWCSSRHRLNLE
jgi:hypothetical protein